MLILSRKKGQSIVIQSDIEIMITAIEGDQVKIGIKAPREMNILRKEVLEEVRETNQHALVSQEDVQLLREWQAGQRDKR
ncbi:carbon storage regulator CsrA [Paenibacillus sp. GCM10023250]|uniref:carbon storage regulator CsrA n=1 Tax=Paenibacillus sp. GCM10023250 TaxID=3252648 RepID=UPI003611A5C8